MTSRLNDAIDGTIWLAQKYTDIKAIVSFGSTNRKNSDEHSDLDLFIFTTNSSYYINKQESKWLTDSFGKVLSRVIVEELMDRILFNRIILENHFSLDIITVDIGEFGAAKYFLWLKKFGLSRAIPKRKYTAIDDKLYTFHYYLKRGYRILYDQVNIDLLIKNIFDAYESELFNDRNYLINAVIFERNYQHFWQSCQKMNTELESGNYFTALNVHDHDIKKFLIQMVHWITLISANNNELDVFYKGAKINDWCDQSLIQRLYKIFPHQDLTHMKDALYESILIYQELSHTIARIKGFKIDPDFEMEIIKSIRNEKVFYVEPKFLKYSDFSAIKGKELSFYKSNEFSDLFDNNYNQFWQYCYKMMAKLTRNDFYYAIFILDNNIKKRLSEMISWANDIKTFSGDHDLIEVAAIIATGIYPHSKVQEMKISVQKTIKIYQNISHHIARVLNLSINPELEQMVETFIQQKMISLN